MRRVSVILVIASMGFAGAALSATSAEATAPAVSGVCKTLTNIHITPSNDPSANGGRSNALKLSKQLSKAAKKSKGEIKTTLNTLSKYFKALGTGDTATVESDAQSFASAATSYASYIASNCLGSSLPKGVTIPKLPSS